MRVSGSAIILATCLGTAFGALPLNARASEIPNPNAGTVNQQTYGLVAAETGDINVWFAGKGTAQNEDVLTATVNAVPTGIFGLDNQTSAIGQYFDLGHVNAGDAIVFEMRDLSSGKNWFTANTLNTDGINHAYVAPFVGGMVGSTAVPAGLYFGFEDVSGCASDWNYLDLQFYTSTGSVAAVPEPSTWAMMILGFVGLAFLRYRRIAHKNRPTVAAGTPTTDARDARLEAAQLEVG